jgi:hypothetical protein
VVNDDKRAFENLLEDYVALDESQETIVRLLKKISNPDNRRKIVVELRNLEDRRVEILDQMHSLGKPV